MANKMFGAISRLFSVVFILKVLKQVPRYLMCLGQCCFVVKLQKCFADYETWTSF